VQALDVDLAIAAQAHDAASEFLNGVSDAGPLGLLSAAALLGI
jgi:hypothetical protein